MKYYVVASTFCLLACTSIYSSPIDTDSLIVFTTESPKESTNSSNGGLPKIYSMDFHTNISNRFATTLVTSKVKNPRNAAAETTFSILLPKSAFISEFVMIIDGKPYKAYVKEKSEAKKIYNEAVSSGQAAAHVEVSARESSTFTVSVNIEPQSKATFLLTYEELLTRVNGKYELILNINPGQIVEDLNAEVVISESRPLKFVETPSLRTGNEISKNDDKLDPLADINMVNATTAVVKFHPNEDKQKEFAGLLSGKFENGLSGQFVVQYDVERDPQGGEVLVRDGYFVHFFSPTDLQPLPKHVVFVLDHSGSMSGRKIEQLTQAMKEILSQLSPDDVFDLVRFSSSASVWDSSKNLFQEIEIGSERNYGKLDPILRELNLPAPIEATKEKVDKAKAALEDVSNLGSTNIIEGLEVGLFLITKLQETSTKKYQPMIVFLTDGQPNIGIDSTDEIVQVTTKLNSGANRASIFSLSFGDYADKKFLQKLSLQNLGFSRHIYEAADASLQLQEFYRLISSPLLSDVTFKYVDEVTQLTKTHHPIFFDGSELVVAGRTTNPHQWLSVEGNGKTGRVVFKPRVEVPVGGLERQWAYLTVKQILDERETVENKATLTKRALDVALKYSFVTEVSSLVVVKPNQTESVDNEELLEAELRTKPHLTHRKIAYRRGPSTFSSGVQVMPIVIPDSAIDIRVSESEADELPGVYAEAQVPDSNQTPLWLQSLVNGNGTITTPQGSFKLGKSGDVVVHPDCPKTPLNGTGECTILFDCPSVFTLLIDETVYLQYFCRLNLYAGICCPKSNSGTIP